MLKTHFMVGLAVQAGCCDEARIVVSTGMQQNEVTGKGLILHNLHYIPHLQSKKKKNIQPTREKFDKLVPGFLYGLLLTYKHFFVD